MSRTHVWLLHRGAPADASGVARLLELLSGEPGRLPGWLAWAGGLGAWHVVGLGGPGPAEAAAWVSSKDLVVLVDMAPHGGRLSASVLEAARATLGRRGARVALAPPLHRSPAYVEALAETLRAAIADAGGIDAYEVVFLALGLPGRGRGGEARAAAVFETARAVAEATRLARPYHVAFLPGPGPRGGSPAALDVLCACGGRAPEGLVIVPLNVISGREAELRPLEAVVALAERRRALPRLLRAAPLLGRPSFVRALAEAVVATSAGLESPEPAPREAASV